MGGGEEGWKKGRQGLSVIIVLTKPSCGKLPRPFTPRALGPGPARQLVLGGLLPLDLEGKVVRDGRRQRGALHLRPHAAAAAELGDGGADENVVDSDRRVLLVRPSWRH